MFDKIQELRLRPIVPDGIHGPHVFDDEEGKPLPLTDVANVDAARDDGYCVDDKKCDIELRFVSRDLFIICYIKKESLEPHCLIVSAACVFPEMCVLYSL